MKLTQLKDTIRNIKSRFVSWLSIAVIATLAVTSFVDVRFSADAMLYNANVYYGNTNFRDFEIFSTMLLTEDDLHEIAEIEGVRNVVGIRSFDTTINNGDAGCDVTVTSLNADINLPVLISGSYPAGRSECLVEADIAETVGYEVGDTVIIPENSYLVQNQFTISGIVSTPNQLAVGSQVAGNRFVLVDMDVFDTDAFDGCYTRAEILLEREADADLYSKSYLSYVAGYKETLESLGRERADLRRTELETQLRDELDEKQALLDDAEAQLNEAADRLEEGRQQIADTEAELAAYPEQLENADKELKTAKAKLDASKRQLDEAKAQLDAGAAQLQSARTQLTDGYSDMLDLRNQVQDEIAGFLAIYIPGKAETVPWARGRKYNVDDPKLSMKSVPFTKSSTVDMTGTRDDAARTIVKAMDFTDAELIRIYCGITGTSPASVTLSRDELIEYISHYVSDTYLASDWKSIRKQAKQWESGHAAYLAGKATYSSSLAEYNANYAKYERGLAEYRRGLARYREGLAAYNEGLEALGQAKSELEEKEAEYEAALEEFEDGKAQLADAEAQLEKLPSSRWIVLNVKGNASYLFIKSLAQSFRDISSTFSLLLVFVAALVIYATVGKIIDEQRNLVGTGKALGLFRSEIFLKYLIFALTASFAGYAVGLTVAYHIIERVFLSQQMTFFRLSDAKMLFEPSFALLALTFTVVVSFVAVFFACKRLVRMSAIRLMQGDVPAGGKARRNAKAPKASLYSRMIIRNMRTDLKRVAVTIVSIAGSCALIIIGLTVSHAMNTSLDIQFHEIYRYNYLIDYDSSDNESIETQIEEVLNGAGAEFASIYYKPISFQNGEDVDSTFLLSGTPGEISDFFLTRDPNTLQDIDIAGDGIYVSKKMDKVGSFREAGAITLYTETMEPFDVAVSGVFDCYIARYLIMSETSYTDIFGSEPVRNQYVIRTDAQTAEQIRPSLEKISGVKAFYASEDRMEQFEGTIGLANAMVLLLTFLSIVMAFFILLNLINMYITQKNRELTIMRINGFTVGEVKTYVGREMILTTVLGILLGIVLGATLGLRIVIILESINSFDHSLFFIGWLIASGITAVISTVISMIALRRIKGLKLTDIA